MALGANLDVDVRVTVAAMVSQWDNLATCTFVQCDAQCVPVRQWCPIIVVNVCALVWWRIIGMMFANTVIYTHIRADYRKRFPL